MKMGLICYMDRMDGHLIVCVGNVHVFWHINFFNENFQTNSILFLVKLLLKGSLSSQIMFFLCVGDNSQCSYFTYVSSPLCSTTESLVMQGLEKMNKKSSPDYAGNI